MVSKYQEKLKHIIPYLDKMPFFFGGGFLFVFFCYFCPFSPAFSKRVQAKEKLMFSAEPWTQDQLVQQVQARTSDVKTSITLTERMHVLSA